jgi:hypothetical protein
MNNLIFIVKALLMTVLPFYRTEFPLLSYPQIFTYKEYDKGKVMITTELNEKNIQYSELKSILLAQTGGWKYDFNSYAPKKYFTSKSIQVNCLDNFIVVNYKIGSKLGEEKWIQISKNVLHKITPL